ncbi:MAG: sigma-70 family RNA polymerase sigma factor [Algoriphagus sp.]|jgi:RNA polymerase sigma-70 factor (ECF subfamily)|uniref:RNA polymerase sigma factor n=1 Tax=Algoriphagus sp. TaxID=1872435 RepID=UPI0027165F5B|nr:sigma-70 family RNA polymerase sigma factor [Algoriphagus sp.]MDO8967677.1 sigma-70 family RNA polymerase sigma factor [Algoriphagus sp.]MDP2039698.1 sigma-70 family RNA polymerase sigma factor [Algoriphagus sp.]MDP3199962.1 sigma-70 family RNA polymerase sigma factor [Algoriphagus sp.]MDP3473680.1 sigma-70 family RNA polymerase sigma factor [Algoriphagus sp.]
MSKRIGPQDSELIAQYRNGSEAAFDHLVDRYQSKVFTTIYLIVKDQAVAEDLLQDVFVKVVQTIHSDRYSEEGKFQPWLMRIAHNLAIDYFRKAKRYPTILMEDGSNIFNSLQFAESSIEDHRVREETLEMVKKLIEELPEAQKEVLVMRHYLDMSFQEIADQTGVSINTALGRMRYALIHLRKKMKQLNFAYDKIFYPK